MNQRTRQHGQTAVEREVAIRLGFVLFLSLLTSTVIRSKALARYLGTEYLLPGGIDPVPILLSLAGATYFFVRYRRQFTADLLRPHSDGELPFSPDKACAGSCCQATLCLQ